MRLHETEMHRLLPAWMQQDRADQGLAAGSDVIIRSAYSIIRLLTRWDQIDSLGHTQLDEMAWELRTPNYKDSYPLEIKRALIKSTIPYYRTAGTPAALIRAVESIFGAGTVSLSEWFEYGGRPGFFRVKILNPTIPEGTAETALTDFYQICHQVKRLSAHLELVEIVTEREPVIHTVHLGGTFVSSTVTRLPEMDLKLQGKGKVRVAAAGVSVAQTAARYSGLSNSREKRAGWEISLQPPKKEEAE